jgi:hypothetical protein
MVEEAEAEDGFISMDNVAARAFEDADTKTQYVSTLREAGIQADMPLGEKVVKQQFATHKIRAENGVEIRFPAELASIDDDLEITMHNDGTVSVLFKNLRIMQ